MNNLSGVVLYDGPSVIDGEPIVMIATFNTQNRKTGNLIQTWIMKRDMHPTDAVRSGEDGSICGDCPHRGLNGKKRSCYVNLLFGPSNIWKSFSAGRYPVFREEHRVFFMGQLLRAGAYGDPVAVPYAAWHQVLPLVKQVVSYTHLWRLVIAEDYKQWTMASVDNATEREEAKAMGWRTYRVTGRADLQPGEVWCPATEPGGHRTRCDGCMGCDGLARGAKRVDFAAPVHGTGSSHFEYWADIREDQRRGIKQLEIFDGTDTN